MSGEPAASANAWRVSLLQPDASGPAWLRCSFGGASRHRFHNENRNERPIMKTKVRKLSSMRLGCINTGLIGMYLLLIAQPVHAGDLKVHGNPHSGIVAPSVGGVHRST